MAVKAAALILDMAAMARGERANAHEAFAIVKISDGVAALLRWIRGR
jgi:hypothetical protein